jgi:predicted CoA-binding protein
MSSDPWDVLKCRKSYAVVGATRNTEKYGYLIFRILADYGYTVYAVNPHYESIDEFPCHESLSTLPEVPEVVIPVVPPAVTEKIIEEAHRLGIRTAWMPPGAGSAAAVAECERFGMEHVDDACVILAVRHCGPRS